VDAGVSHVCVCPGSRSTSLTLAAAQNTALHCSSHIDERSAGFFALGLAKATRLPVALVCTSGTAAANFHPAVIEAYYAGVPLIVLSADRPPELREWGAGQTIDQVQLYARHVRWFAETAVPESTEPALRYAKELAARAVAEATGLAPGPVHLNIPFRDPLVPPLGPREDPPGSASVQAPLAAQTSPQSATKTVRFHRAALAPQTKDVRWLAELCRRCERGVISCGPMDADPSLATAIAKLATQLAWPVLAEPTSQLRSGPHTSGAPILACSDLFLRDPRLAAALAPEVVLRFGTSPTSKALKLWLEQHTPAHVILVDPTGQWQDPTHLATDLLQADPLALCEALTQQAAHADPAGRSETRSEVRTETRTEGWLAQFTRAERTSARAVDDSTEAEDEWLEPRALRELATALPDDTLLYVSNSMPVRDLDAFLPVSTRPLRVLCNRGASGIDGMISSALGAAAGQPQPVVLLIGDLAFLHDVGALLTARRNAVDLTIVVFDNDGGGIFSFLPVARVADAELFERHFRTPHGTQLGPIAESFGASVARPVSWEHFRSSLKDAIASPGVSVVELAINRDRSVEHHREIERRVGDALRRDAEAP